MGHQKRKRGRTDEEPSGRRRPSRHELAERLAHLENLLQSRQVSPNDSGRVTTRRSRSRRRTPRAKERRNPHRSPSSSSSRHTSDAESAHFPSVYHSTLGSHDRSPVSPARSPPPTVAPVPDSDTLVCADQELEQEVLAVLGVDPSSTTAINTTLHSALVSRWTYFLANGLDASEKATLLKKYTVPKNCLTLRAPEINPEVIPALQELILKKDKYQHTTQGQLGIGLSMLGQAINLLMTPSQSDRIPNLLPLLIDTGKLLTDVFYHISKTRRYNLAQNLNKSVREVLQTEPAGAFLFGNDLGDRLKQAQSLHRCSLALKVSTSSQATSVSKVQPDRGKRGAPQPGPSTEHNRSRPLNLKGPSRLSRDQRSKGQISRSSRTYNSSRTAPRRN